MFFQNWRNMEHVWILLSRTHAKIFVRLLAQNHRREWTKAFAEFNLQIHILLHLRISRIAENRTTTQRAPAEFHPSLKPSDYFALLQKRNERFDQLRLA